MRSRNTIAPCHGWIHALVFGEQLHLIHNQRSGDTPIGVPSNMAQYTALGLMLEQLTGYEFVEYVHWIQYAHIYANQLAGRRGDARARAARAADAAADRGGPADRPTSTTSAPSTSSSTDYDPHPAIARHPGGDLR